MEQGIQFLREFSYPIKVRSKLDIAIDMYLEGGILDSFDKWGTGIYHAIKFDFVNFMLKNIYT